MPNRAIRVGELDEQLAALLDDAAVRARFAAIRQSYDVPNGFPIEVLEEAATAAAAPLEWPDRDETSIPFLTLDPPGSMDLDQALHIERSGEGFRVRYAIAYLPAFVAPGGLVDAEARRRGQTIYAPDERTPLHPPVFSEGAASLLPNVTRPAYVWDLQVREDGEVGEVTVYRALVRSVDRFDYDQVQRLIDEGTSDERVALIKEVGQRRLASEKRRGGASLPMPEQRVTQDEAGRFVLGFRPPLPAEEWNAQISLMTGMAAAELMLAAKIGILRTMPSPDQRAVARYRRQARALGIEWRQDEAYGDFLRRLDRTNPRHLALVYEATSLFRGSGYAPFDGDLPAHPEHGALAAPYAHVTAPLRRLVDRFGLVVAEAISAQRDVPAWAREALSLLPDIMAATSKTANGVERACTDTVEAAVLSTRLGESLPAVVVDRLPKGKLILQLTEPAVVASARGEADLGDVVVARLVEADVAGSTVRFEVTSVTD